MYDDDHSHDHGDDVEWLDYIVNLTNVGKVVKTQSCDGVVHKNEYSSLQLQ